MLVVKEFDKWAVNAQQTYHNEALYTYGEKVIIRRIWTVEDFLAERVTRCATCSAGAPFATQQRITEVYKSSGDVYCVDCFGVGFTGGFEPTVYWTYALIKDEIQDIQKEKTGVLFPRSPFADFAWTPDLEEHDIMVRITDWETCPLTEEARYELREVKINTLRTSPGDPTVIKTYPASTNTLMIGQIAQIHKLPPQHPYNQVGIENL